jgi:hypothetical protein
VLDDIKLILVPKGYIEERELAEIMQFILKNSDYKLVEVEGSFFEGGNIHYLPEEKVLLHGLDPVGGYLDENREFRVDPKKTNEQLAKVLKPYNIKVVGVEIDKYTHGQDYYHLDCYTQPLVDGRFAVLNMKMLTDTSRKELETILKDKLLDLKYSKYNWNPVLFNLVGIQTDKVTFTLGQIYLRNYQKH